MFDKYKHDETKWAYMENDGWTYRCMTCLTVAGSMGEAKNCTCPYHREAIKAREEQEKD